MAPPVSSPTWSRGLFNNPYEGGWKPPEAWDVSPVPEPATLAIATAGIPEKAIEPEPSEAYSMSLDLNGMQRELKRMAAASPSIILVRLKEEWGKADDATLYKELEMEKKRWMLSALHNMDRNLEAESSRPSPSRLPTSRPPKVLALHESQGMLPLGDTVHLIYH